MKITNDTTTWQIAEMMGNVADETDGRIMMGIFSREMVVDTDEIGDDKWEEWLAEACATRRENESA